MFRPITILFAALVFFVATNSVVAQTNFWQPMGLDSHFVDALAINDSGDIFAGTGGGGVFRSADHGNNWVHVNTGLTNLYSFALKINSLGHIFAGNSPFYPVGDTVFVYRSTNNGDNWTAININIGLPGYNVVAIGIDCEGQGVVRSTDNGESWDTTGLTGGYTAALAINSSGHIFAARLLSGLSGIYRSTDGGTTWDSINTGLADRRVQSFAINSTGYIFAGTRGAFTAVLSQQHR